MDPKTIVNNAEEYLGIAKKKDFNGIQAILAELVREQGEAVYLDTNQLKRILTDKKLDPVQVEQICLMANVPGMSELLKTDAGANRKNALDRYLKNALEVTGFTKSKVMEIGTAIALSVGIEFRSEYGIDVKHTADLNSDIVPFYAYQKEMNEVQNAINASGGIMNLKEQDKTMSRLMALAKNGVPRAKYFIGYYLLEHYRDENAGEKETRQRMIESGIQYLKEAAEAGDSLASLKLAGYYYSLGGSDNFTKSYDYYTGAGTMSIGKWGKEAVTDILNYKKVNKKILVLSIVIAALSLLLLIVAPAAGAFAPVRVAGGICVFLELAVVAVGIMHFRKKPYDSINWLPCAEFFFWAVYMIFRILV